MINKIRAKLLEIKNKFLPKRFSQAESQYENEMPETSTSSNGPDLLQQSLKKMLENAQVENTAETPSEGSSTPPSTLATQDKTGDVEVPTSFATSIEELNPEQPADLHSDLQDKLYEIPKANRFKYLSIPLGKLRSVIEPLSSGLLSKVKKQRPDLFSGTKNGSKLNLNKLYDLIFSPDSRPVIHRIFLATFAISFCYVIGKSLSMVLKGKEIIVPPMVQAINIAPESNYSDLNSIRLTNLFNSFDINQMKKNRGNENVKCELAEAQSQSSLQLKLVNTVVLQDSVKSIASVQVRGRSTLSEFREGEKIENLAKVDHIDRLKVIIRNLESNQCEYISNESENIRSMLTIMSNSEAKAYVKAQTHPEITNNGNSFTIKKKFLQDKLKDIGAVLTQAKAVKITNPDGSIAFKITEIEPGGVFASLIQMDDTITSINGKKITSLNEVMDLLARIKDMNTLSLGVIRDGEARNLNYSISN